MGLWHVEQVHVAGTVLRVIDQRSVLLDATNLMEGAALDRYEFIRDGYLQQRKSKVFDGETSRKEAKEARKDEVPNARGIAAAYADDAPAETKETQQGVSSETPAK
jgi:phospholipid-binding lipoprotein MlaA